MAESVQQTLPGVSGPTAERRNHTTPNVWDHWGPHCEQNSLAHRISEHVPLLGGYPALEPVFGFGQPNPRPEVKVDNSQPVFQVPGERTGEDELWVVWVPSPVRQNPMFILTWRISRRIRLMY